VWTMRQDHAAGTPMPAREQAALTAGIESTPCALETARALVWRCWSGGVGLPWRTRYGSCFGLCEFVERWEVVLEAQVVGDAEDAEDCGGVADGELDVGLGEKAG
jgi:hypothetical protein